MATAKPATPRKTAPRKTAAARKAEATKSTTSVEHAGVTYEIPAALDMPVGILEAQDEVEAIRLILGQDQWDAYKATGATIGDFSVFADKITAAAGQGDAGN
ncbi:hypothetical protein [Embleya hyalina]|uniref:Uncharacterized protein n=1 Tax=Embleya hyalina TaxID=516124 RepID=A0A401YYZ9_9ACTN|nr:hypothetical protein [Embleya hyalina]GCD99862.1 hypothetical protein EHYA_07584 [Embleya hyalina]